MRTGPTLALAGACATLFGASFLAADVMGKDEKASAPAPLVQKPKVQQVEAPEGRALSLARADGLPALRKPPKPKPKPKPEPTPSPAPAPSTDFADATTAEEPAPAPEPVAPAPVEAPVEPTPTYTPPAPDPVPAPAPTPAPDPPPATEFWGSG